MPKPARGTRRRQLAPGQPIHVLTAGSEGDFEKVFASLVQLQVGALLVAPDGLFVSRAAQLAALAVRYGLPAESRREDCPETGGLMSYGDQPQMPIAGWASTSAGFSRARNRPICRSCSRQVRAGDQPQDRQGARPDVPPIAASQRRRGDRIMAVLLRCELSLMAHCCPAPMRRHVRSWRTQTFGF